jgi:hypothetical protein
MNVHNVSDVRQIESRAPEPPEPDPSRHEVAQAITQLNNV